MKIKVNGEDHEVDGDVNYDDIFSFAHPGKEIRKGASVTYLWKGDGDNARQGILAGDKSVMPAEGMVFNCYFT